MKRLTQLTKLTGLFSVLFLLSCHIGTQDIRLNTNGMEMEQVKPVPVPLLERGNLSPDGQYFLTGGQSGNVFRLWSISRGEQAGKLNVQKNPLKDTWAAITPDNQYALSTGNSLTLWDLSKGREIRKLDETKTICVSSFTPDGGKIATLAEGTNLLGATRYTLSIWDTATWKNIARFKMTFSDFDFPTTLALSPDGKYALLGNRANFNGDMIILDAVTGESLKKVPASRGFLKSLKKAVTDDPFLKVTASEGYMQGAVLSIAFSPDGQYALTGGLDNTVRIWEIPSMNQLKKIEAHTAEGAMQKGVLFVAYSPDGKYFLTGGGDGLLKMWDASSRQEIRRFGSITGDPVTTHGVSYAAFLPNGKQIISAASDGAVRIWDMVTGREVALFLGFEDGEWLVTTGEGYYNASGKGAQYLKVKYEENGYTIDQFYNVFYRPDIVAAKLNGQDIRKLVSLTMKDARKYPPPVIRSIKKSSGSSPSRAKVCYKIEDAGGGIGEVRLFHNGKLVRSGAYEREIDPASPGKTKPADSGSQGIFARVKGIFKKDKTPNTPPVNKPRAKAPENCLEIDAINGVNEVSVTAFNNNNSIQGDMKTVRFKSKTPADDPQLYILSVGIDRYQDRSLKLKYAVKDARDIVDKLRIKAASLFKAQNIHCETLTDEKASKANVIRAIDSLAKTIKPQDSFILFAGGYGVLSQDQYYMLTHDFNGQINMDSMISSSEIEEMSGKIKSTSQLFIFDTCHAGAMDAMVSGLYNARMSFLARKMGLNIYASAGDQRAALDGYGSNGLFTHVLLEGLDNRKEVPRGKEGKVTVVSLGEYVKKAMTNLPGEAGYRQTPLIITYGRDNTLYKIR